MPRFTQLIGVALAILGVFFYVYTDFRSFTALIPTFFGLAFFILGLFATGEKMRKHMMHGAAALALLGFGFGAWMVVKGLAGGNEIHPAFIETAIFGGLCGLLLVLCVKSFIDARRRRTQRVEA